MLAGGIQSETCATKLTTRPTAEFEQHHDIEAPQIDARSFRAGWRVRTRLDGLLIDGAITPDEWQAGIAFRDTWERALPLRTAALAAAGGGGGDPDAGMLARLGARTRLRQLGEALGFVSMACLVSCAVQDLPWREVGLRLRVHHETARTMTVRALQALARVGAQHAPCRATEARLMPSISSPLSSTGPEP